MMNIETWVKNPNRDYFEGVSLLEAHCPNRNLVRYFANRSPRFAMDELVAEVSKLKPNATVSLPAEEKTEVVVELPDAVVRAKELTHEAWVKLSKMHRQLFDTGTSNDEKSIAARLAIMNERDPLVQRYNSLYEAKEMYFSGEVTLEQLQKVVDGMPLDDVLHPKASTAETAMDDLTDVEVLKRLKAAKQAVVRNQNLLLYQQPTAAAKKNPMPKCPKRDEIQAKLKERTEERDRLQAEKERRGL